MILAQKNIWKPQSYLRLTVLRYYDLYKAHFWYDQHPFNSKGIWCLGQKAEPGNPTVRMESGSLWVVSIMGQVWGSSGTKGQCVRKDRGSQGREAVLNCGSKGEHCQLSRGPYQWTAMTCFQNLGKKKNLLFKCNLKLNISRRWSGVSVWTPLLSTSFVVLLPLPLGSLQYTLVES